MEMDDKVNPDIHEVTIRDDMSDIGIVEAIILVLGHERAGRLAAQYDFYLKG
jgi:hypothetical protein